MGAVGAKSGQWLTKAVDSLTEWQLNNPHEDEEAAVAWAKEHKDSLVWFPKKK